MLIDHLRVGKEGEEFAYNIVKRMGYKILEKNYRCSIGEVDLIALDGDVLVFIEIKTRRHSIGYAKEAVNRKKRKKLLLVASYYMKKKKLYNRKVRFDVIAIQVDSKGKQTKFELIKNAFLSDE